MSTFDVFGVVNPVDSISQPDTVRQRRQQQSSLYLSRRSRNIPNDSTIHKTRKTLSVSLGVEIS